MDIQQGRRKIKMRVIFSGGPVNNQCLEIPDVPEYRFPMLPEIKWNDYPGDNTKPQLQSARYQRTEYIDPHGMTVYEFIGIQ